MPRNGRIRSRSRCGASGQAEIVEESRAKLPMRAFFFDCLHYEDQSIEDHPRGTPRGAAKQSRLTTQVPRLITRSESAARAFYDGRTCSRAQGLMAKALDTPYEAEIAAQDGLKISAPHSRSIVLAAEWGHGAVPAKLQNLHLGALDPVRGSTSCWEDVQGPDGRPARLADEGVPARETHRDQWTFTSGPNSSWRLRSATFRRAALSRRPGVAARASEALS